MRFKLNDNVTTCLHLEANCLCKVETGVDFFFHTSKHITQREKKNIEKTIKIKVHYEDRFEIFKQIQFPFIYFDFSVCIFLYFIFNFYLQMQNQKIRRPDVVHLTLLI